jgi:glyoxylase-like metal-dependent hydrolase (beta-lactamase superfamily II)
MRNFAYAIGDRETGEAVLVDPAYHPGELIDLVAADGLSVTGVLCTHYHFDHVGGEKWGMRVAGIKELLEQIDVPIHANKNEVEWIEKNTGVDRSALVGHDGGDVVSVGAIDIELIHTPGHTEGSQCLLVNGCLMSGDTLFLDGCGRTDLPGADPEEMYVTLSQRLSPITADTRLFPGHLYSPESSALFGDVRQTNFVLAPATREQWLANYGS